MTAVTFFIALRAIRDLGWRIIDGRIRSVNGDCPIIAVNKARDPYTRFVHHNDYLEAARELGFHEQSTEPWRFASASEKPEYFRTEYRLGMLNALGLAVLLMLLFSGSAYAQPSDSDPVFRVTVATKISMGAFDLYYTGRCLEAGTCREGNPGLRWAEDSWALPALKMGIEAGTAWILLRVRDPEKPWYRDPAFWTAAGLTVAQAFLVKHNYDLYQRGRR